MQTTQQATALFLFTQKQQKTSISDIEIRKNVYDPTLETEKLTEWRITGSGWPYQLILLDAMCLAYFCSRATERSLICDRSTNLASLSSLSSCFLSLLLVAAVVWKIKQTCWASRRREVGHNVILYIVVRVYLFSCVYTVYAYICLRYMLAGCVCVCLSSLLQISCQMQLPHQSLQ